MDYESFKDSAKRMSVSRAASLFGIDPSDYGFDDYKEVIVYAERCYIGVCHDRAYHLLIENQDWLSSSLSDLEPKLYEWFDKN